ncbi:Thymidylate kinase [Roseomonas mucosa]|uniref:dTMP kinase n=1 Tax=Roseomonas TaxID=125216 RepID=UPI0009646AD3|nr:MULTISPECIES: dTMP kinase [Roseomonas]ATR20416.1 dTMP kinase [Roseomonas sp. FDAARGOS_362]USQ71508.1 dTMP kinase [Roseomonas mucosa]UZO97355.1 Thymidylate kinase [Roseomonas mucosa]GAV33513.1 Thymidylate kinase [Roseomonas sp. TAS13]
MAGRLITLEGGEGAGKTTLARALVQRLALAGLPVLRTREPGGAPGAEAVRRLVLERGGWDPVAEAMLMAAARREHVAHTVRPALEAGIWVVSDRFADSTMVYQGMAGDVGMDRCRTLAALALDGLSPDLTLVLDIAPAVGTPRAIRRGDSNHFEDRDEAFHERVRQGFRDIAAAEPARCAVLDAGGTPQDVLRQALTEIRNRLGLKVGPEA